MRILQVVVLSFLIMRTIHAKDNPSTRAAAQTKTIDLFADALYWYTSEAVDWAYTLVENPNGQTNAEIASYKTFRFDWAPGFRVGLGYSMEHDQWDTQASYTWFQSKAKAHASGIVTSLSLAARLSLLEPFSTGKASLNVHYNMFDWDLGRSFLVSHDLSLRPSIGVKAGWIGQTIHSYWTEPPILGIPFAASDKLDNDFQGGGPKGGITAQWYFGNIYRHSFSLVSQLEAGYLWGHWSMHDKFVDSLNTVIFLKTSKRNFGAFMLHAFLGLGWECNFDRDRAHFAVKLGYEIEDWFNQFQLFTNLSGSQNNDLIFQGATLKIRFDF